MLLCSKLNHQFADVSGSLCVLFGNTYSQCYCPRIAGMQTQFDAVWLLSGYVLNVIVIWLLIECDCYMILDCKTYCLWYTTVPCPCDILHHWRQSLRWRHMSVIATQTESQSHSCDVTIVMKPLQSVSNVEGVSMLCRHHMIHTVTVPYRYWYLIHRILPAVYFRMVEISTHWGRVTHICVGNRSITGTDHGLSPGRR